MSAKIDAKTLEGWFAGRLPDEWFTGPPVVTADREEIVVVGTIAEPEYPKGADDAAKAAARRARIQRFREETREARMRIADEAEERTGRKVAWGARCGDEESMFTSLAIPVMTRLRMRERQTLDTLVGAGVARSRSDALAWCVRLVRDHEREWIDKLRDALVAVAAARANGPTPS
jgi:hypothetical protein